MPPKKKKNKLSADGRFMNGCAGKVQHKSKLSATYFLETSHSSSNAEIYKCSECGFFHIGTSRDKEKIKIKKIINRNGKDEHKHKHKRFKY